MSHQDNKAEGIWDRFWRYAGRASAAVAIGKLVVSSGSAGMIAWYSHVREIPGPVIIVLGMVAFTATIWGINGLLWIGWSQGRRNGEKAKRLALIKAQMCELVDDAKDSRRLKTQDKAKEWRGAVLSLLRNHLHDTKYSSDFKSESDPIDSQDEWKIGVSAGAAHLKGLESMLSVDHLRWN